MVSLCYRGEYLVKKCMSHDLPKAYDPTAIEDRWAEYWVKERLFDQPSPVAGANEVNAQSAFTILLPPPNVTGRLHMGHMLNQTEMDIISRWHRMLGQKTLWVPGTDHAGIATQMMVERQLATEGKTREGLGRDAFVERVWEWKRHYGGAIFDQMKRLGASVDWSREYFTMDDHLSVAVREAFVRLHEQGLIYRGAYIVNWCPRCQTALSDLEVVHEEQQGKLWEIRYRVVGQPGTSITVATTRPETMLGDVAVAVHPEDERYLHLHGKHVELPLTGRTIPVVTDDWVSREFGTGAVKVTPAHDPNDFAIGERHGLPSINIMDETAHLNSAAGATYAGLDRYEARKKVLEDLEAQDLLVSVKDHVNSVGKCDRCKTVVEPRLSTQWFIKIQPLADKAIAAVELGHIKFTPEQYSKTYFEWMRNIHDWCISRQLWWGHRIPAWHCLTCRKITVARDTPESCSPLWQRYTRAGNRCAGHLVLIRATALHSFWLARAHTGTGHVLSNAVAGDQLRYFVFLGSAHDNARLPLHVGCSNERRIGENVGRCCSFPRGLHSRAGARRRPAENVEDQRERGRSHRHRRSIWHRRSALHAGGHGFAGHGYRIQRGSHGRAIAPSPTRSGTRPASCS